MSARELDRAVEFAIPVGKVVARRVVDRLSAIGRAILADRVEAFEREARRIDHPRVAALATGPGSGRRFDSLAIRHVGGRRDESPPRSDRVAEARRTTRAGSRTRLGEWCPGR